MPEPAPSKTRITPNSPHRQKGILFTAFEPSGDALAAPVIAELKRRHADLAIYAWGGPKMKAAGAELIEETVADAEMAAVSIGKIFEHVGINKRIRKFVKANWIGAHIPVDAPAANFPICKITRRAGCRVIHLAAPQIWAWAPWRIRKLRKRTDKVLCLLPFEEKYFKDRQVPARFIGHPIFSNLLDAEEIAGQVDSLPHGSPKLALLPGSRPAEIRKHIKPMVKIFAELKGVNQNTTGVIVAANSEIAATIHKIVPDLPVGLFVISDRLHAALDWAELGLICSGTATLDATRFEMPMVVMYRINPLAWYLIAKWLLRSDFFALPNLIAGREVVPEFVPFFGNITPIVRYVREVLAESRELASQREALGRMSEFFANVNPAALAADEIMQQVQA